MDQLPCSPSLLIIGGLCSVSSFIQSGCGSTAAVILERSSVLNGSERIDLGSVRFWKFNDLRWFSKQFVRSRRRSK